MENIITLTRASYVNSKQLGKMLQLGLHDSFFLFVIGIDFPSYVWSHYCRFDVSDTVHDEDKDDDDC